ncbi:hypothetical protein FOC4_g10001832 [Fusarium odoratissimum]|uniref:NACHT domain-containing protein n=1 Tax=Fusarium oxysporum f. sp. cubense (strain race 4) TaxID=2502994 RepID=N1S4F0_FUSC4|nr:hypothetical protein FOC4_g10001832 [Fusarium odoratissimum]
MTLNDTIQPTQNILERRNDLCKLTRIQRFLHAIEHIEELVAMFLSADASGFVAFIWGPIKLALMITTTWTDAVRQLIDAYEEIAEALEGKKFFKWAWECFRREVKPIAENLKRKRSLLSDDKLQSHVVLKEVQDSCQYTKGHLNDLQTSLEDIRSTLASEQLRSKTLQAEEMKDYLASRLDVSKSRADLQFETRDPRVENSGNWILSNPIFNCWERGRTSDNKVLFLNGSPGSGKSTLARTIIRYQKRKQASEPPGRSFLACFFFKHDVVDRRIAHLMLQHFVMQLVNADETIMRFAHEKLSTMEATELADLKNMANDCLTSRRKATLVLDGLDEMSGRLEVLLSSYPQIRLDMIDAHQQDIDQFIKDKVADVHTRFPLKQQEEETLVSKISSPSQGIFLYARLVLEHLAAMDSIQDFEDELEDDTFPEDLDRVYDHKEICNIKGLRRDSCKSICSSLVGVTNCDLFPDIESEQVVGMVHETAARYLVRNGTINLVEEHINMALFCCRYLSSRPFTTGKSQSISADVHSGYFGLLDYAAAHYIVHIREIETSEVSTYSASRLEAVKAAVVGLAKANCKEISLQAEQSDKTTKDLNLAIEGNVLTVRALIGP